MTADLDRARAGRARLDVADLARRAVVAVACGAGLVGILAGRPTLSVAWRVGAIAGAGLLAIAVALRVAARARPARRGARGGAR